MLKTLGRLRHIKEHREQKAERAMIMARRSYVEAVEEVKRAREALENYKYFMVKEENRLYASLMGKTIRVSAIEEVRDRLAMMQGKSVQYQEEIVDLEKTKDQKMKEWDEKKVEHAYAVRQTRKFVELQDHYKKEKEIEDARAEENDLEELASAGFIRNSKEEESDYVRS